MRIVVAGAGKLGYSIAELLTDDEFDVIVVENDPKRKEVVQNSLDVLVIEGNACSPTMFRDPDIRNADVLIACTDSDEVNMITCMMAKNNGINGDLLVVIEEQEHPNFKREGNNLFYTKIISIPEAILGGDVEIPGIDGTYKIKVEPGTQSGTVVRLKGRGLPTVNGYGGTGDLYVKVAVWIPKKLDKAEKEMIESMRGSSSFNPANSKEDKGLFDRLKDLF